MNSSFNNDDNRHFLFDSRCHRLAHRLPALRSVGRIASQAIAVIHSDQRRLLPRGSPVSVPRLCFGYSQLVACTPHKPRNNHLLSLFCKFRSLSSSDIYRYPSLPEATCRRPRRQSLFPTCPSPQHQVVCSRPCKPRLPCLCPSPEPS